MRFSKSRILSARRLSHLMKEFSESGERFCFILGSGASVESGIPSGSSLEMQWMDCLMGKMDDRGMPPMDADETREIAAALCAEKELEHEFREIEDAWLNAKKGGRPIPSEYYFDIYRLRFHANPHQGCNYLERIMERCDPSLGYHTLAKLLTENSQHNLVITTNFDSLVEDALFLYTNKKPLVVSHESLVDYMEANIQRPIVAKVHRGLLYSPFNNPETTRKLKAEWEPALRHAFTIYTPIVIGYAGGDHSLMSFLEQDDTIMRNGVYWCYRGKCDPSNLPGANIQEFVQKRKGYFVAIDGFDALMVEIGKTLYNDAIRPGRTEEKLRETHDNRMRKYHEQWDSLNEKIGNALHEMNATEQQEEEQREKEESLTARDHFRRGLRADKGGHKQEAIQEYTKAIEMDPQYASAYNNRGILHKESGDHQKALEDYNKAIELNPNYAIAYLNRGNLYFDLGDFPKALQDYNKALELNPNYVIAYNNRGNLYRSLKDYLKAIEDYGKAIELEPNYAAAYHGRGIVYHISGDRQKALKDYDKAIELDPNCEIAYLNRGILYANLAKYQKAVKDYAQAIQLKPQYRAAYQNRANAYEALGETALAEADRKTAAEL